jgi:hypothetical protein
VDEGEPEIKSAGLLEGLGRIRMWRIVLYALGRRFGGFTARDIMSSENLDTAHAIFSAWSDLYRINLIKRESRVTGDIAFGRVADIKTGCPKFTRTAGAVGHCEHVDCLVGLKFRYQRCFSFYLVPHSYKLSYTSTVIRLYVLSCSIQCIALKADSHPVSYLRKAKVALTADSNFTCNPAVSKSPSPVFAFSTSVYKQSRRHLSYFYISSTSFTPPRRISATLPNHPDHGSTTNWHTSRPPTKMDRDAPGS